MNRHYELDVVLKIGVEIDAVSAQQAMDMLAGMTLSQIAQHQLYDCYLDAAFDQTPGADKIVRENNVTNEITDTKGW